MVGRPVKCTASAKCPRKATVAGMCQAHHRISVDNGFLDSTPVRTRIVALQQAGWSRQRIADAAGLASRESVRYVLLHELVCAPTARAIMSIPLTAEPRAGLIPAVGIRRRIQALAAIGWPRQLISEHSGVVVFRLNDLVQRDITVIESNAIAVRAAYESLCMTPGPSNRVRARAARAGWAPPLAWDDNIDDPDAVPDLGRTVETGAIVIDLRSDGLPDSRIAEVLGIKVDSVQQAARRYEQKAAS